MKKKIEAKNIIDEIKKINGKKNLKIKENSNLIKLNHLDSFGYVELASVIEKKFKKKLDHSKFFDYKNASIKSILKILNEQFIKILQQVLFNI